MIDPVAQYNHDAEIARLRAISSENGKRALEYQADAAALRKKLGRLVSICQHVCRDLRDNLP